jgi:hypothetical protein
VNHGLFRTLAGALLALGVIVAARRGPDPVRRTLKRTSG